MNGKEKVVPVCPTCGGRDILRDAYATWDAEAQRWVLFQEYDPWACQDCGAEGKSSLNWKPEE